MGRGSIFWGTLIILVGIVLLLGQFFPGVNVWGLFWPFVMILLGLWFLFGRRFASGNLAVEQVNLPLEDAREAKIRLYHGAGRLEVSPAAAPAILLSGLFAGGVEQRLNRSGAMVDLDLRPRSTDWFVFPGAYGEQGLTWTVNLTRDIPVRIEIESGASETRLNLQDLLVTELTLKTGASSTVATLPAMAGLTRVNVQSGAASVELRLPEGVAARIQVKSGLAGIHIDSQRFPAFGSGYETPGYDTAANRAEIYIETGVGSVDIR
jgi:hypothetical protein